MHEPLSATAAHDKPKIQRTTFAAFPAGVPCVVVLPSRGVGKHQSQDRYLNKKGGFTGQRRLAQRFQEKSAAAGPAHEAWRRVIGVLLLEPADLVNGRVPPPAVPAAGAGLPSAAGRNRGVSEHEHTAAPDGLMPTAVAPTGTASEFRHASGVRDPGVSLEGSGLQRIATRKPARPATRAATRQELARLTSELHA